MATHAVEQTPCLWPAWYTPPRPQFEARKLLFDVAADMGITRDQLVGQGRIRPFVHARAVVAKILHERGWSTPMIGRILGGRDHTTIMNLLDKFPIYSRYASVSTVYALRRCPVPGRRLV